MEGIHIEAEDWMMTAGLIGFTRLFPEDEALVTSTGIFLQEHHLQEIAERFFRYLLDTFNVIDRDVHSFSWYTLQLQKKPEKAKTYAADVRKRMNDQVKKVQKYFPESQEYQQLKQWMERMKEIKKEEDLPLLEEAITSYERLMSVDFIREKLTLNYVKSVILGPFFGQTSFLQRTFNARSTEDHVQQFQTDFVSPALDELRFYAVYQSGDVEEVKSFLHENVHHDDFKRWQKALKKMSHMDEIHNFFKEKQLPCSFIDELVGVQSFEEKIFGPLAFSKDKAVNFSWEFDKKTPVPISATARLLLFLVPLGLAFYSRKIGTVYNNDSLRYGGLVLSQQSFPNILKENETYYAMRSREGNSFGETVATILQESMHKADKLIKSYQIIEVHSNIDAKKTLLDAYHMPVYLARYLGNHGNGIKLLYDKTLRDQFVRTALKGQDTKQVLFDYVRLAIAEPFHAVGAFHAVRERACIQEAREGVEQLRNQDKRITFMYYQGVKVREAMVQSRGQGGDEGPYRASGRKKLESIAYRLLNALKAGNQQAFMDTVFRLYMNTDEELPSMFLDTYKEDGLDFETVAGAFISGLMGNESSNVKGEKQGVEAHG
ncbi:hypothetical protein G4V62_06465 [Bacillaceae bacterium SIJ1]|uniref:hypothetical protein n=1 Tax=Litoribacterium kuwaitense TaxID=1398745 RepID=UPI0013EA5F1F|nr:hypothetical protein [Litoribacterium kuwaitense]NGP44616.1 hypothetical protein [Litoribacterium kuwaitense]